MTKNINSVHLGTVQSIRKGLPELFKGKSRKPRGTVEAFRCDDMLALSWHDKRQVLFN